MVIGGNKRGGKAKGKATVRQFSENPDAYVTKTAQHPNNYLPADDSSSEEEDPDAPAKGIQGLIITENPNDKAKKFISAKNLSGVTAEPVLSRREKEELAKQQAKDAYMKRTMEGKTDQARNDLARLAIIKKQREEAAAKRAAEQEEKAAQSAKQESLAANKSRNVNAYGF